MANIVTFTLNPSYSGTDADDFTIVGVHENGSPANTTIATGVTKSDLATGVTYTIAETITGGTITAKNTTCDGTSINWTITAEPTPTPTITPSNELSVYLRDVASIPAGNVVVYYTVNGGSAINLPGATNVTLPISCSFIYAIGGLNNGDIVEIGTNNMYSAAGQPGTSCPSGVGGLSTYTYTYNGGDESIALTFDTSINP